MTNANNEDLIEEIMKEYQKLELRECNCNGLKDILRTHLADYCLVKREEIESLVEKYDKLYHLTSEAYAKGAYSQIILDLQSLISNDNE